MKIFKIEKHIYPITKHYANQEIRI